MESIIINYLLLAIVLFIHSHTYYYTGDKMSLYVWELIILVILFSIPILCWIIFILWVIFYLWNLIDDYIKFRYNAKWMNSRIIKKIINILKKDLYN
jgi:hypothetical protein